jgi:hypothetical protein
MSNEREVLQPLEEPVTIRKALLAGRVAQHTVAVGGEHSAFLVNIQLTGWNNTEEYTKGFVDGFNRAAEWMQAAVLAHLSADTRDAARFVAFVGAMLADIRGEDLTAQQTAVRAQFEDNAPLSLDGVRARIDVALAKEPQ